MGLAAAVLTLAVIAFGCAGKDAPPATPAENSGGRYPEGSVDVAVELLDTGLAKGNASAEAKDAWKVAAISVTAADPKDVKWEVLEFPEGVGSKTATEFFEVVLQELPRGDQITITATATFEDEGGKQVERSAEDHWPP